ADRGADEMAHARGRRQPLAEDRAVQARDAERLRAAGGSRDDLDVGGGETVRADAFQRALAGAYREDGFHSFIIAATWSRRGDRIRLRPGGTAMIHLYYWTTPNGHKVTMYLEEADLEYTIKPVNIGKGD